MKSKELIGIILGVLVIVIGGYLVFNSPSGGTAMVSQDILENQVDLYKSPSCGCCGFYAAYLRRAGFDVTVHEENDIRPIKERYGVPKDIESCHTTVIGDRVIEGHMPIEGIEALFGQSEVMAISLPGMPSGSPGMPGSKKGAFTVYSFGEGIEPMKFMEL